MIMRMMQRAFAVLLSSLWLNLVSPACLDLVEGDTQTLYFEGASPSPVVPGVTPENNCVVVPSDGRDEYRLAIRNSVYGRYELSQQVTDTSGIGFAWNPPADGIYYCVESGSIISFTEFVDWSFVTIQTEDVIGDECNSDYISFNGLKPVDPDWLNAKVAWTSHTYSLTADEFVYQVDCEGSVVWNTITADKVDIGGDPGDSTYSTIEVTWDATDGKEKRFYAYMRANNTHWEMFEVRVYNENEDWEYFYDPGIAGRLEECYVQDGLEVMNEDGTSFAFHGLRLATFLPWSENQWQDCFSGLITHENDQEGQKGEDHNNEDGGNINNDSGGVNQDEDEQQQDQTKQDDVGGENDRENDEEESVEGKKRSGKKKGKKSSSWSDTDV
jgi:hypothetical protein